MPARVAQTMAVALDRLIWPWRVCGRAPTSARRLRRGPRGVMQARRSDFSGDATCDGTAGRFADVPGPDDASASMPGQDHSVFFGGGFVIGQSARAMHFVIVL